MKWFRLPVKALKCVSRSWVYMSKFGVQGVNNVSDAFEEVCPLFGVISCKVRYMMS